MHVFSQTFSCAESEDQYLMQPSMGSIPKDVEGTLFKNGPSKFRVSPNVERREMTGYRGH